MSWYLRSRDDQNTHQGQLRDDGTVLALCRARFTPSSTLTIANGASLRNNIDIGCPDGVSLAVDSRTPVPASGEYFGRVGATELPNAITIMLDDLPYQASACTDFIRHRRGAAANYLEELT